MIRVFFSSAATEMARFDKHQWHSWGCGDFKIFHFSILSFSFCLGAVLLITFRCIKICRLRAIFCNDTQWLKRAKTLE